MISYHHHSLEQEYIFLQAVHLDASFPSAGVDLSDTEKQSIFKMNDDANCSQKRNLSKKKKNNINYRLDMLVEEEWYVVYIKLIRCQNFPDLCTEKATLG